MTQTKFQTLVEIPKFKWETGYEKHNMFIGSCFTENIGQIMVDLKYNVDINPFGILYNPMSVAKGVEILLERKEFEKKDLIQHNELWHSFYYHGKFSSTNATETLNKINQRIKSSSDFLCKTDCLFLTFGTAWVYRYVKTNKVVSNCHKIPAKEFIRERISIKQIVDIYSQLLSELWQKNPNLKVVFTISPIRHWKDGAIENQRSKSTLFMAIDELEKLFPDQCFYFPSYEIVMDELRDYRFYASDMLHLSDVAVNHIWERFEENLINAKSLKISKEIVKINNAVKHRPLNPKSPEYHNFITNSINKIEQLEQQYPFIKLKLEKDFFIKQICNLEATKDKT